MVDSGALVWARFETYAFWPGQVCFLLLSYQVMPKSSPEGEGVDGIAAADRADQYLVRFFGTHDIAWVPVSNVVLFKVFISLI
jgi:hypothetical protein